MTTPYKSRRYILADPSFTSYSGHCFEYIQSLALQLRNSGHEVLIAGNRGLDSRVSTATGAYGVFTYWCDARPTPRLIEPDTRLGEFFVRRAHERSVFSDLNEFAKRIDLCSDDTMVLNTFRHWGIRGIVEWADKRVKLTVPKIVLILHFSAEPIPGRAPDYRAMYRDAFERISKSPNRDRFVLLADSAALVAEYRTLTTLPIAIAPIPHAKPSNIVVSNPENNFGASLAAPAIERGQRKIRLTYAGEARTNKGFQFLPYAITKLEELGARPFEFEIQSFIHNPEQRFYQLAMAKLKTTSSCQFLDHQLDSAEYDQLLRNADVIVVPYLMDNYHAQTSGIYAEAVSLAKPVIVPMGTWMAEQVRTFGGGITFPPGDYHSLFEAAADVIDRYEEFKRQAEAAAEKWNSFHNAQTLVRLIDAPELVA